MLNFFKCGHEILVKENITVIMLEVWHKENNFESPVGNGPMTFNVQAGWSLN